MVCLHLEGEVFLLASDPSPSSLLSSSAVKTRNIFASLTEIVANAEHSSLDLYEPHHLRSPPVSGSIAWFICIRSKPSFQI